MLAIPARASRGATKWLSVLTLLLATACGPSGTSPASLSIAVVPGESPAEVRAAIPGQQTSFLVSIADSGGAGGEAVLTATAVLATVDRIIPTSLQPGHVAEVWVTVDPAITADTTASVSITASRGGVTQTVQRSVLVRPMSSEGRERDARPHFEHWASWLAANHPELGMTAATEWQPVFVSTLLVVSHMSYFSAAWEMGLSWHAGTIPPYDWSQIYLRRRGTEMNPSIAYKLDSFTGRTAPYAVTPPDVVVR